MSRRRSLLDPTILGLRLSALFALYRQRLKHHGTTEVLAGGGIAVGVALVFGVLVANGSLLGSTEAMTRSVNGSASLRVAARSSEGFSEALARKIGRLPSVLRSAALLRESAAVEGPRGSRTIQLVGIGQGMVGLGGAAMRDFGAGSLLLAGGIALPADVGDPIGAQTEGQVTVSVRGSAHPAQVRAVLDAGVIGPLASSGVAVALLPYVQRLTGLPGRVSEVLVKPRRGRDGRLRRELERVVANTADVLPASSELTLLENAARPTGQSSSLFAAISLMVGFLLALNAMLLTIPERRRQFAEMRAQGYDSHQVLAVFSSQALILGCVASVAGVAVGQLLAATVFRPASGFLSVAFPVSGQQSFHLATALLALGAGIVATLATALGPLADMLADKPADAVLRHPGEPGQAISARTARWLAVIGALVIVGVTITVLTAPAATVPAGVILAVASLSMIPLLYRTTTCLLRRYARRFHGGMTAVAVIELEGTATRAVVLAGVAAIAVFGGTAIGGARSDLINGLDTATVEFFDTAPLWVTPPVNDLGTTSFKAGTLPRSIASLPDVAFVHGYQGGLLDVDGRRIWVRARPPSDLAMLQASQIVEGRLGPATLRLRDAHGWAAVSDGFAKERRLRVGRIFALPTPSGTRRFRVAVITSNVGWPPGAITLNTADYQRYWRTSDPSALEVGLKRGVPVAVGDREVERVLRETGVYPALRVQTAAERIAQFERNAKDGLRSLSEIVRLLLLMTALALAGALGTAIYQRRARFAALKAQGFDRLQLWRCLLLESVIILTVGCLDGSLFGVFGHALADRYLRLTTGFPAPFHAGGLQVALTLLLLAGMSLSVISLPGYLAASTAAQTGFQE